MKAELLATLEEAIAAWADKQHEEGGKMPTDVFYPEDLYENMAKAAAITFDANRSGQLFAEGQKS